MTQTQGYATRKAKKPSQKRECHNCPRNGNGDDYCWKVCRGPADDSRKGVSFVSLDAMPAADNYLTREATDLTDAESNLAFAESARRRTPSDRHREPAHGSVAGMSYDTERALVVILASLMSLTDIQLCIFRHVYLGQTLEAVGESLPFGISKQAVSKHVHAICASHPAIARMFAKAAKGDGGQAPALQSREVSASAKQLDMFGGVVVNGTYARQGGRIAKRTGDARLGRESERVMMSGQRDAHTRDRAHYTPTYFDLSI